MLSGILSMRWVSIAFTVLKWGSLAAVVGYLGWNVVNNKNLREELSAAKTEISVIKESYSELKRRVAITEKELSNLQESRHLSRQEAKELKNIIKNLNIQDEDLTNDEAEHIINELWNNWINELHKIPNN